MQMSYQGKLNHNRGDCIIFPKLYSVVKYANTGSKICLLNSNPVTASHGKITFLLLLVPMVSLHLRLLVLNIYMQYGF